MIVQKIEKEHGSAGVMHAAIAVVRALKMKYSEQKKKDAKEETSAMQ